jgi:hypothetical protein
MLSYNAADQCGPGGPGQRAQHELKQVVLLLHQRGAAFLQQLLERWDLAWQKRTDKDD